MAEVSTGESTKLTHAQLKRNMRAIDDGIDKYACGEWSAGRFEVFLRSVGLKDETIAELLHDLTA